MRTGTTMRLFEAAKKFSDVTQKVAVVAAAGIVSLGGAALFGDHAVAHAAFNIISQHANGMSALHALGGQDTFSNINNAISSHMHHIQNIGEMTKSQVQSISADIKGSAVAASTLILLSGAGAVGLVAEGAKSFIGRALENLGRRAAREAENAQDNPYDGSPS